MLITARDAGRRTRRVYMQLGAFYNRQGQFDKTIEASKQRAAQEPNNPEAYYTIATYYWDKTFRDNAEGAREARVHQQGRRGDRQGDPHQERLPRSDRLQGPAAPPPGEHRKGPQAAGSASARRPNELREPRRSRFRRRRRRARATERPSCRVAASANLRMRPQRENGHPAYGRVAVVVSSVNAD